MRKCLILWLVLVGLIFGQLASALETEQVCNGSLTVRNTNWNYVASLPLFDPNLGVLTKVDVTVDACVYQTAGFENEDPTSEADVEIDTGGRIRATLLDGNFLTAIVHHEETRPLTAYDGVTDYAGTSGHSYILDDCGNEVQSITDPTKLQAYIASSPDESKEFALRATGFSSVDGSGNIKWDVKTKAGGSICIKYYYETCDDNDACTTNSVINNKCDFSTPTDCNDNNACTIDDCGPETGCTHVAINCDDGKWCNGAETCDATNGCQPGTAPDCNDSVACTVDSCNELTDSCDHTADDTACDDGVWCNGAETCDATNGCQPGTAPDCNDSVACTVDSCNELTDSCDHTADDTACDDGKWCNGAETCDATNGCQPGTVPDCNDSVACTVDSCNELTDSCDHTADDTACDDGKWCNGAETCDATNGCQPGTAPDCNDSVACTVDSCNELTDSCDHTADDTACDDGVWCNGAETCDATNGCQPGTAPDCNDSVACTVDSCNEDTDSCDHAADDTACDDGVWCNGAETCDATNGCQPGTAPDCNDSVACTVDSCNEETDSCDHTADDTVCDDGKWCNGAETCDATNGCQPGTAPDCNDSVACTVDSCNEETDSCDHTADDTVCDDGKWCNGAETCDATNGCQPGTAPDCNDSVACTVDSCNEDTDSCDHAADDTACDDGVWCNGAETCDATNGCQPGTAPDCNDSVACTVDSCNEDTDSCDHTADDTACDDGDVCNGAETCDPVKGCVAGTPVDCNDDNLCTIDTCDATDGCQYEVVDCDDNDACTVDSCDPVKGCTHAAINCDDGNPCTIDTCDPATGCVSTPIGCDQNDCEITDVTAGCITPVGLEALIKKENPSPCGNCDPAPVFNFPNWPVDQLGFVASSPAGQPYEYTVTCNPGAPVECDSTCIGEVTVVCECDCSAYAPDICLPIICVQKSNGMYCKDYSLPAYRAELKNKVLSAKGGCSGECSKLSIVLPPNINWNHPSTYDYKVICEDASGKCSSTDTGRLTLDYNCGCGPCGCSGSCG